MEGWVGYVCARLMYFTQLGGGKMDPLSGWDPLGQASVHLSLTVCTPCQRLVP